MSAELRDRQKRLLCEALAAVRPDAPTLCEGWSAHDLAVHVWLLKREPLAWPGVAVRAFAGLTGRRAEAVHRRWSYAQFVERLVAEPGWIACMPADALEGHRHALGEYFVHTQDVARPNDIAQPDPDAALADALWRRAVTSGRLMHRRRAPGYVLDGPDGASARIGTEPQFLVSGRPGQLLLWVHGRESVSDVTVRMA